ncbi:MFS transporter [Ornithinicoccus hortensis]|uniref:Putative MFS family arabinose efflux permease n=1 Tax=Ornithinicoccus hortensis TaxID=82346 RepID=A0A542YW97_9MICO|nr:MFS transporter [Ornithinicoccus hortensis]TQL52355.1 putative MFS family arabinose efflux permease [Ornithinicoccus hortensis]
MTDTPPVTSDQPRGARALLGVASTAVALAAADTYVVVLALPDMMAGAGLGIESLQKGAPIISGFLLGYIAVLPLIGRLSDLVERRRILLACLLIFVVGSAVTAAAVDLPVMIGGRVLQGLGGGGLVPATLALVADLWPPGRRGTPLGIVGAVQELGSVLGPLLGAAILLVSSWRGIFWLNVVLGLLFFLGVWLVGRLMPAGQLQPVPEGTVPRSAAGHSRAVSLLAAVLALAAAGLWTLTLWAPDALVTSIEYGEPFIPFAEDSSSRVATPIGAAATVAVLLLAVVTARRWLPVLLRADVLGAAFVALALGALVLTFSTADPESEVLGPWGLWLLPVGAVALLAFWIRQRTAANPLIQAGVVRGRVTPALVVSLLVGAAIVAIVVDVPLLARLSPGTTQTDAAFELVRFLVAVPVGAVAGGVALRRLGPGVVAAPGLLLAGICLFVMAGWDRTSLADTVPTTIVLVLAGLGVGLAIAPVNDAALADAVEHAHGTVSSLVVVARMVGMVVGLALLTAVGLRRFHEAVAALPDPGDSNAVLDAAVVQVHTVFLGAGICSVVAAAVAVLLGWHRVAKVDRESQLDSIRS